MLSHKKSFSEETKMARNKNDYFKLIEDQLSYCVSASDLLSEILASATPDNIADYKEKMHEIEHKADDVHHNILSNLSAEFITPIDQEDILHLVQIIDDITDAIDEVVMKFYMFDVKEVPSAAIPLSEQVKSCVFALRNAGAELKNFKKPEKLRTYLIDVNTCEGEADDIYFEAMRDLFTGNNDFKKILGHRSIYDSLEECCDLCEHASDIIEQIIIKNT